MDKLASEYKVLIVDDVPTNVMLVQAILKKEGYTLLTCDSGTKALRIANEKHPNLILLDIMMPEMDGYEVLQHLKSNPETTDIPVIIMSALSDMQSIVKGYQLGATEYVTKPFQREVFFIMIRLSILSLASSPPLTPYRRLLRCSYWRSP